MDKEVVKAMAYRVNCDAEKEAGDIQKAMTDKLKAEENLIFYVHYKLLFKLVQMGISIRKMNGLQKGINATVERNKELDVKVTTWKTISDNLAFGTMLKSEADRMRNEEIATLQKKHDMLKEEIEKIESKDFVQDYFSSLLE